KGKKTLQVDFQDLSQPRQAVVLKGLATWVKLNGHPSYLSITNCMILTADTLAPFLSDSIEVLDINNCEKFDYSCFLKITTSCRHLRVLELTNCTKLTSLYQGRIFAAPFDFPYLEYLAIKDCPQIKEIYF